MYSLNLLTLIMMPKAAITSYLTILSLITGTLSENEIFYQGEGYCRRLIPPLMTSAMGLCTFPCVLWSSYQPPRVLVQSEPDGTHCKINLQFQQMQKVGKCRGGLCQEKHHYEEIKRIRRDVSTTVLSSQNNTSAAQKVAKSGPGSAKSGTSRGDPLEQRRREMWDRCDCVSIRGLFLDMTLPSGLGRGARSRRGKRRKVGCRIICLFLISRYKNDPKWASLFAARLGTVGSTNARNATSGLSEGAGSVRNATSEQKSGSSSKISTGGLGSESYGTRINGPGATENAGAGISNIRDSGSAATGALNGATLITTGGGTPGGNILSPSSGSVNVGATGTSISGSPGVPQNAGNMGRGEVSNITAGGAVLTSTGSGADTGATTADKGSRVSPVSPGSASSASSGTEGSLEAGTPRQPSQSTKIPSGISGPPATVRGVTELGNGAETSRGQDGGDVRAINSVGSTSGRDNTSALLGIGPSGSVASPSHTASSSSGEVTTNAVIRGVGSGVSESASLGSLEKSSNNTSRSGLLDGGTNGPPRPTVESVSGPSDVTPSGTSSGTAILAGAGKAGSGGLGMVSGSSNGISTIKPVARGPENAGGLSSIIPSSVSGTTSVEGGENLTSVLTGGSESRTVGTATGISASRNGNGIIGSSTSGESVVGTGVPRGGGVLNGEENVAGISGNGAVGSGAVPASTVIPGHPSVTNATSPASIGAEGVGTTSKPTEASGTSSGKPGATTVPSTVSATPNGAGKETNSGVSGAARTSSGEAGPASARVTTGTSSTVLPGETGRSVSGSTTVVGPGSYVGGAWGSARHATGNFPSSNGPYNFGGAYSGWAGRLGTTGSGMNSGLWGLSAGTYNAYANSGGFGNMPGMYPMNSLNTGRNVGYGANGPHPGNIGLFDDDIFFQN